MQSMGNYLALASMLCMYDWIAGHSSCTYPSPVRLGQSAMGCVGKNGKRRRGKDLEEIRGSIGADAGCRSGWLLVWVGAV